MGLVKDLRNMAKEYRKNPKAQHFKYLKEVLDLGKSSGVSPKETLVFCQKWYNDKTKT